LPCQASQAIQPAAPSRTAIQTPSRAFIVRDMTGNMVRRAALDKPDGASHKRS
jgi:hypothetical protein